MAAVAETTSSTSQQSTSTITTTPASSPIRLTDLHPDILLNIFQNYIPLHDKLHVLSKMKEFRRLVRCRGAYRIPRGAPFSNAYLRFLSRIRPGWYVARDDWTHCFRLQIDESTLHVSLRHYVLFPPEILQTLLFQNHWQQHSRVGVVACHRETLPQLYSNLNNYLVDYHPYHLLAYHLPGYGYVLVEYSSPRRPTRLFQMRFYDGTTCMIEEGQKREMRDFSSGGGGGNAHFSVLFSNDDDHHHNQTITVECLLHRTCRRCDPRVRVLSPFEFRFETNFRPSSSSSLNPAEEIPSIPLAGQQVFRLEKDGFHVLSATLSSRTYCCPLRKKKWKIENKAAWVEQQVQQRKETDKRKRDSGAEEQQQQQQDDDEPLCKK